MGCIIQWLKTQHLLFTSMFPSNNSLLLKKYNADKAYLRKQPVIRQQKID